jgi:hypothetical protein
LKTGLAGAAANAGETANANALQALRNVDIMANRGVNIGLSSRNTYADRPMLERERR